jgi:hypothetical protein
MRAKLRKLVWKQVESGVSKRLPKFELFVINPKELRWKLVASSNLFFFVSVWSSGKGDAFVIELKWNILDEYTLRLDGRPVSGPLERKEGGYRLQDLWNCKNGEDVIDLDLEYSRQLRDFDYEKANQTLKETGVYPSAMKTDVDTLIERAPAVIEDALDKLVEHGLPFFHQVAKAHGVANLSL